MRVGGKRPGAGRKRGDGRSKRTSSSKYVRPVPDPRELKPRADAELHEAKIIQGLDRAERILRHRRRWLGLSAQASITATFNEMTFLTAPPAVLPSRKGTHPC